MNDTAAPTNGTIKMMNVPEEQWERLQYDRTFWRGEAFRYMRELTNANKGIRRLKAQCDWLKKRHRAKKSPGGVARGVKPLLDYASLDWTKPAIQLQRETGVSYQTIIRWRNNLGKPRAYAFDYASLDWSKSNTALAREHKLHVATVSNWRIKLGHASPEKRDVIHAPMPKVDTTPSLSKVDPATINWNLTDIELSRAYNCTREYVRQMRARHGKPRIICWERRLQEFKLAMGSITETTIRDACKAWGRNSPAIVKKYCALAGIRVIKEERTTVHPYKLFDWRLPNRALEKVWGVPFNGPANYRCKHGMPLPQVYWQHDNVPEEWREALEAQRILAKEWKVNQQCANELVHTKNETA